MGKRNRNANGHPNATGRSPARKDRSLIIRRDLWQSPNVSALSVTARALMLELTSMFNGTNNGQIYLSNTDAAARLGLCDRAAARKAFVELQTVGLLTVEAPGYFAVKAGKARATRYRIHWVDEDGKPRSANELPVIDPGACGQRGLKRLAGRATTLKAYVRAISEGKFSGQDSCHYPPQTQSSANAAPVFGGQAGQKNNPAISENLENPPFGGRQESCPDILVPKGPGDMRCPSCFSVFIPERANQRFCLEACRRAAEYRRSLGRKGWWGSIEQIVERVAA